VAALGATVSLLPAVRRTLYDRVGRAQKPTPVVAWAWRELRASDGRARIAHLVREANISHRHLVRRFHDEIGMTPKAVARLLRFEHSIRLLRQGRPLAQVASEGGYCDQAHLHREFRTLAGRTPGTMMADLSNTPTTPAS
jgi:transcriptional regulator GlxA family with amidase domain